MSRYTGGGGFQTFQYSGPGDVVPGAYAWWGLRAYSNRAIGRAVVNIRRDSDNTSKDFATVASGNLDVDAIKVFQGSANLFVATLYDQSGHGRDLSAIGPTQQPALTLAGLGGNPIMTFSGGQALVSGAVSTMVQPFCLSTIIKRTANFTSFQTFSRYGAAAANELDWDNVANTLFINGGSFLVTATDNAVHTLGLLINGASSSAVVDGASTAGNAGTNPTNDTFLMGSFDSSAATQPMTGVIAEQGWWNKDISGSFASLNSNQHSYWGF